MPEFGKLSQASVTTKPKPPGYDLFYDTDPQSSRFGKVLMRKVFYADEVIFRQGDEADQAFYIIRGEVDVIVADGEHEVVVTTLKPGEIFGEMALIEPAPRSATVKATQNTELAVMTRGEMAQKVEGIDNTALRSLLQILIKRLRQANNNQFSHYKNLAEFSDRMMGLVKDASQGIDDGKRDAFREEVIPHLEAIEKLLQKYRD